jgi:succinate dehydrogenase/fumarate reductase flavoprotein subunit
MSATKETEDFKEEFSIEKKSKIFGKKKEYMEGTLNEEEETKLWKQINNLKDILYKNCQLPKEDKLKLLEKGLNDLKNVIDDIKFRKIANED